jgi:hypothetical protein
MMRILGPANGWLRAVLMDLGITGAVQVRDH